MKGDENTTSKENTSDYDPLLPVVDKGTAYVQILSFRNRGDLAVEPGGAAERPAVAKGAGDACPLLPPLTVVVALYPIAIITAGA